MCLTFYNLEFSCTFSHPNLTTILRNKDTKTLTASSFTLTHWFALGPPLAPRGEWAGPFCGISLPSSISGPAPHPHSRQDPGVEGSKSAPPSFSFLDLDPGARRCVGCPPHDRALLCPLLGRASPSRSQGSAPPLAWRPGFPKADSSDYSTGGWGAAQGYLGDPCRAPRPQAQLKCTLCGSQMHAQEEPHTPAFANFSRLLTFTRPAPQGLSVSSGRPRSCLAACARPCASVSLCTCAWL
uniref:uncharacterized protein LOC128928712 n=1 Tax=Callithrix jacchus TaxID=9483 RepID=UPI0023DD5CD3|nr:uncharacterized protein LOC128928712 [Callithrix jacchus]